MIVKLFSSRNFTDKKKLNNPTTLYYVSDKQRADALDSNQPFTFRSVVDIYITNAYISEEKHDLKCTYLYKTRRGKSSSVNSWRALLLQPVSSGKAVISSRRAVQPYFQIRALDTLEFLKNFFLCLCSDFDV